MILPLFVELTSRKPLVSNLINLDVVHFSLAESTKDVDSFVIVLRNRAGVRFIVFIRAISPYERHVRFFRTKFRNFIHISKAIIILNA